MTKGLDSQKTALPKPRFTSLRLVQVPAPVAGQPAPAVTQEIPLKPGTNIFESPFGDFPDLASPDTQIKDELELWNLQAEKMKSIFVSRNVCIAVIRCDVCISWRVQFGIFFQMWKSQILKCLFSTT